MKGFQDTVNTVAWWELAVIARLTQRRVVAVEATLAFGSHGDAATFESVMKWAGYQIAWKGRVDTKLEVPTDRPKYFMVFWNSADQPSASTPFRMLRLGPYGPIPCEDCIWKPMRPDMFQATEVKKEMMAKVTSRELLPPFQKRCWFTVHLRLVNPNAPMPSVPMSYNRLLSMAWPVLMKKGMQLPLVEQDGKLRLLSKWELARAAGLPGDLILPEPESDANLLLCQATLPCQALQVLGSIIAHRQEMVMTHDTLLKYYETGLKECSKGWEKFSQLEPFARATWATLISNGDEAQMGTEGRLRSRLRLLQQQLDNMADPRKYGSSAQRAQDFQVGHGYTGMLLDEEEPTAAVHEKIAEFLAVPAHILAVARVDSSATHTRNWVVAGEMLPHLFDEVIVLVDTGIPQAQWLPSELEQRHLSKTYGDHHASYPDSVEINGYQVLQWPASLASGDFIRLRWNGYSDHEDWKDLD
ncbi:Ap3b2, partial [Symbiodinium microadriaticum]